MEYTKVRVPVAFPYFSLSADSLQFLGESRPLADFDPYYKWLGIPPAEQPPNHYRLLGVVLYEPSAEVISNAADRQMAHIRTYQHGAQSAHSQKLLNQLSSAKLTLLNPKSRAQYDEALRANLAGEADMPVLDETYAVIPLDLAYLQETSDPLEDAIALAYLPATETSVTEDATISPAPTDTWQQLWSWVMSLDRRTYNTIVFGLIGAVAFSLLAGLFLLLGVGMMQYGQQANHRPSHVLPPPLNPSNAVPIEADKTRFQPRTSFWTNMNQRASLKVEAGCYRLSIVDQGSGPRFLLEKTQAYPWGSQPITTSYRAINVCSVASPDLLVRNDLKHNLPYLTCAPGKKGVMVIPIECFPGNSIVHYARCEARTEISNQRTRNRDRISVGVYESFRFFKDGDIDLLQEKASDTAYAYPAQNKPASDAQQKLSANYAMTSTAQSICLAITIDAAQGSEADALRLYFDLPRNLKQGNQVLAVATFNVVKTQ